jgi:hypothetical protein
MIFLRALTLAGVTILLVLLWKQHAELTRLKQEYRLSQPPPPPAAPAPPAATPPPPETPAPGVASEAPLAHPAPPEKSRLEYTGTAVSRTATGLVAILHFKASQKGPLGMVGMSVRLPGTTDATLQSIRPAGAARYEESESTVSESGRFAFFQGTAGEVSEVQIALGISSPAHVYIKGNRGIGFFLLDIQPTNATAIKQ